MSWVNTYGMVGEELRRFNTAGAVERIRGHMETHLGCTAKEVSLALGISYDRTVYAIRKIRNEWKTKGN